LGRLVFAPGSSLVTSTRQQAAVIPTRTSSRAASFSAAIVTDRSGVWRFARSKYSAGHVGTSKSSRNLCYEQTTHSRARFRVSLSCPAAHRAANGCLVFPGNTADAHARGKCRLDGFHLGGFAFLKRGTPERDAFGLSARRAPPCTTLTLTAQDLLGGRFFAPAAVSGSLQHHKTNPRPRQSQRRV
jgi:hypothetical protein